MKAYLNVLIPSVAQGAKDNSSYEIRVPVEEGEKGKTSGLS